MTVADLREQAEQMTEATSVEWMTLALRSLLARDRKEMAELVEATFCDEAADLLRAKADEMEKP